ncbi:MAG: PHB depolymerase family esterase [Pedobacter sp.]|nr:PHB depolymerase family esterase [Pedobacter sp.]
MRKGFLRCLFLLLLLEPLAASAQTRELSILTPNGYRRAILAEADKPASTPRPVVLILHGHTGSAEQALGLKRQSPSPLAQWVAIAERENIIVLALDGARGSDDEQGWNDCRKDALNNPQTDDVAFARNAVKKLVDAGQADPARIYAMGMSNGGMMAFRLGLQMPELAAFAAAAASMAADTACPGKVPDKVAALIIGGDADPLGPWRGGQVKFGRSAARGGVMPVPTSFSVWAAARQLDARHAVQKEIPPQFRNDQTKGRLFYFGASPEASPVTLLEVENGGHVEPSLEHRYRTLYLRLMGQQSSVVESAEFAWSFFRNKSRTVASAQ